ncbi:hypothetical protein AB4589_20635 [Vibrio sp. 10N.222.49.A3]|uniref:hypothetical protein n=1 Tax=Vibrio sp. 10N.222.49.A3 TaxID=3229611 RepID=UPI00354DE9C2
MKVVTELHTMNVALYCPHCNEEQDGFIGGGKFECDDCKKPYKIHSEADIEHK